MTRKLLIVLAPLLLIALLEGAFRMGVWDPMASALSHAGTSVRLKRALLNPALAKIDFVTLGSSRPQYGIDHEQVSIIAKQRGLVHANLSMPGTHWMSVGVLSGWLSETHPEIKGGVLALSVQDLAWPGNGNYELGIVQPFRSSSDSEWIGEHVTFESSNVNSFGRYSALFAWRDDVRDFLTHPIRRIRKALSYSRDAEQDRLFSNPDMNRDMCKWGVNSISSCDAIESDLNADSNLKAQCSQIRTEVSNRPDYTALVTQTPLPQFMKSTRELVQAQIRRMNWAVPPVVVLMPMPRIWRTDERFAGLHQWALSILQPLQHDGTINLIDATSFFDSEADGGCAEFGDFYHQNSNGRDQFSEWLVPQLELLLYSNSEKGNQ